MGVTFRPRIQWPKNELLLPADLFGVTVPSGLADVYVRAAKFVDVTQMSRVSQSSAVGSSGGGLAIVNGLVTRELEVSFANPAAQWRRLPGAGGQATTHGPGRFQFLGGEIFLNLTLGIYILTTCEPDPHDDLSVQIFAAVYGHELQHVADEIDIVTNWLPPRIPSDSTIASDLVQAQPFTYGTSSQRIEQAEQEFHRYMQSRIQSAIRNGLWAHETNLRARRRDAPSEYQIVQDRVDTLRARQINR